MDFEYIWKNKEANFGLPEKRQIAGGTHITFEIILKKGNKYVTVRRPDAIPGHEHPPRSGGNKGLLYFCHNLIRYGESIESCIGRIVKEQTGVSITSYKLLDIESHLQEKDKQWAFMPYVLAELEEIPTLGIYGNQVSEVVLFNRKNIPDEFGWWKKEELEEFLNEFD